MKLNKHSSFRLNHLFISTVFINSFVIRRKSVATGITLEQCQIQKIQLLTHTLPYTSHLTSGKSLNLSQQQRVITMHSTKPTGLLLGYKRAIYMKVLRKFVKSSVTFFNLEIPMRTDGNTYNIKINVFLYFLLKMLALV